MKKMKSLTGLVCLLVVLSVSTANAFKLPKKIALPKEETSADTVNLKTQITQVLLSYQTADAIYKNAVLNAAFLLADKQEKSLVSVNNITKAEQMIITASEKKQIKEHLAALSESEKKLLADCSYNIALSNMKFAEVLKEATPLSKELLKDPALSLKLRKEAKALTEIAGNLPEQAKTSVNLGKSLLKIGSQGGLSFPAPASAVSTAIVIKQF